MQAALDGLIVVEYCQGVPGSFAAKILADMGAEVVKIEPVDARRGVRDAPPACGEGDELDYGVLFLTLNCNKKSITLDVSKPAGPDLLRKILARADVFIEDFPPGHLSGMKLGYHDLVPLNEGIIYTSLSPFGQSGPYKALKMHEGNLCHASGQSWLLRDYDEQRTPLQVGGMVAAYDCGVVAAIAILAATYEAMGSERGQFIDISLQEASMAMDRVQLGSIATQQALNLEPAAVPYMPIYKCSDGYIVILPAEPWHWDALVQLMGSPSWAKEDRFATPTDRRIYAEDLTARLNTWTRDFAKEDLYHLCQRNGVPAGPARSIAEVVGSEQMQSRGFFQVIQHPVLGEVALPAACYSFSETPWVFRSLPPELGEHNQEVYVQRLGLSEAEVGRFRASATV